MRARCLLPLLLFGAPLQADGASHDFCCTPPNCTPDGLLESWSAQLPGHVSSGADAGRTWHRRADLPDLQRARASKEARKVRGE